MGRSVSIPHRAIAVCYLDISGYDEFDFESDIESDIEYYQDSIKSLWKSFEPCDEWLDREDRAILENELAYVGVSTYCGLMSLWLVPKEDEYGYYPQNDNLAVAFCNRIAEKFERTFSQFNKIGTFSNGEAVFERV